MMGTLFGAELFLDTHWKPVIKCDSMQADGQTDDFSALYSLTLDEYHCMAYITQQVQLSLLNFLSLQVEGP